jgi:hypothetical protein
MGSHHNTTNESEQLLIDFQKKAIKQEEMILSFFKLHRQPYAPSQVHTCLFDSSIPLTSVRRAMTNLTYYGLLKKTELKMMGSFGRPEYLWSLT